MGSYPGSPTPFRLQDWDLRIRKEATKGDTKLEAKKQIIFYNALALHPYYNSLLDPVFFLDVGSFLASGCRI